MTAAHPTDETLIAYGLGKIADADADGVVRHLEACAACKQRVADLSADSFVARFRDAQADSGGYTGLSAAVRAMPDRDAPPVAPPELLALTQYTGLKELGRGGMGVVYLARHVPMDRLEVLKVVQRSSLERAGAGAVERFLREIQAAARLQHPNVVAAYTVHQPGDLLVFAMEYAPGSDLAQVVRSKGPLAVPVACSYVCAAALGVQHAHEAGMVHRDIKPGNLILTKVNGKPTVKVLDFGLAKVTTGENPSGELTGDGKMMGTPDYMAPEQAMDAARADIRADVYALGCTLYYLLAGRAPFRGGSLLAVIDHHRYTTATALNLVQPAVPVELAAAVAKMMAKDPAKRYQTPGEVAKAVRPFAAQPATKPRLPPAPPPSPADTSRPEETAPTRPAPPPEPADRTPDWGAVTATPARPVTARPMTARPAAPPRRRGGLATAAACGAVLLGLAGAWAAGVFTTVKTPDGTIVIENAPDGAEVTVDGAALTVTRNGDAVTVSAVKGGPHKLRVVVGGKELLAKDDVVVTVGGEPVRVRVEAAKAAPTPPPPPKPADPPALSLPPPPDKLVAGSVWTGTRTYTKGAWAPATVNFELHVVSRDGAKFAGHVYDNGTGRNEAKVEGELTSNAVKWTERSVHDENMVYHATGSLDGTTIRATEWRERFGKHAGEAYVVVSLPDKGAGFRKGDPIPADADKRRLEPPPAADGFVPLFNGKELNGWRRTNDGTIDWNFSDGVLVGRNRSNRKGDGGAVMTERKDFGDFHLRFEVRLEPGNTSAVEVRTAGPDAPVKTFRGYQIRLKSDAAADAGDKFGGTGTISTSYMHIEPTPVALAKPVPSVESGAWYTVEVVTDGSNLSSFINGQLAATHRIDTPKSERGAILLACPAGQTVQCRGMTIREASPVGKSADDGFRALFNGKDKSGWSVRDGSASVWQVADGVLTGRSRGRGSYLYSDAKYADFQLRAECRISARGNSGIFLRADPKGAAVLPGGYEAEIQYGSTVSNQFTPTGTLLDGDSVLTRPGPAGGKAGEWFTYEATAVGNIITLKINEVVVATYTDPRSSYTRGHVVLQAFEPQTVVEFRKIELRNLPGQLTTVLTTPGKAVPPVADSNRSRWVVTNPQPKLTTSVFRQIGQMTWLEVNSGTDSDALLVFKELKRTAEFVELERIVRPDEKLTVRLFADRAEYVGSNEQPQRIDGGWKPHVPKAAKPERFEWAFGRDDFAAWSVVPADSVIVGDGELKVVGRPEGTRLVTKRADWTDCEVKLSTSMAEGARAFLLSRADFSDKRFPAAMVSIEDGEAGVKVGPLTRTYGDASDNVDNKNSTRQLSKSDAFQLSLRFTGKYVMWSVNGRKGQGQLWTKVTCPDVGTAGLVVKAGEVTLNSLVVDRVPPQR